MNFVRSVLRALALALATLAVLYGLGASFGIASVALTTVTAETGEVELSLAPDNPLLHFAEEAEVRESVAREAASRFDRVSLSVIPPAGATLRLTARAPSEFVLRAEAPLQIKLMGETGPQVVTVPPGGLTTLRGGELSASFRGAVRMGSSATGGNNGYLRTGRIAILERTPLLVSRFESAVLDVAPFDSVRLGADATARVEGSLAAKRESANFIVSASSAKERAFVERRGVKPFAVRGGFLDRILRSPAVQVIVLLSGALFGLAAFLGPKNGAPS